MEGRVPAASADPDTTNDDPPLSPPRRPETYVIQIPKDQIYRVPPPENALIAERFRNPETKGRNPSLPRSLLCVGIILFALCLIFIGITLSTLFFALSPEAPTISILHVVVTNPKHYDIYLKTNNANSRTGIYYEKGGSATLLFGEKNVGEGEFPMLYQQESSFATVQLVIDGNKSLPREMEKSINETKSDLPVPLALKMEVPVTMNLGFLKIWKNEILVDCKFKLSALRTNGGFQLLSQECETTFEP
ncbi:hypothetical protein L484_003960 [Morus notabilis]|uniref:Late embryogenesis abundant protein LEA-2 subgroup domain-containing protein n=1 Tax=Morus notabilis TaxID=981085 RepID=W9RUA7_9ROSA|nr:NDR1/HIN1-like protein 13 [Morus notabilis]EXB93688.1 hypothetical protein L484_003960 [Morus notabilis]